MDQDWTPVVVSKTNAQKTKGMSNASAISSLKASGNIVTEKKFGSGGNHGENKDLRMLDDATDAGAIKTVDRSVSIAISQARQAKKMTQKELAQKINELVQVVQNYECGKAGQILVKLDKALGVKLPRGKK